MTSPKLSHTVPALAALYAAGAAWAVADDLAPAGHVIASGTTINAPLVIVAAQVLGAIAALRLRGRGAVAGLALVLVACTLSLSAAALDGDLGHAGLTGAQVAWQVVIIAATAATWWAAAARLVGRRGAPAVATS